MIKVSQKIVEFNNCYKIYRDQDTHQETVALRGVNFEIVSGEIISILGPSGSGKTSLLNLLGGIDQPNAGSVIYFSETSEKDGFQPKKIEFSTLGGSERDDYRIANIGILTQNPVLIPGYTAIENVELTLKSAGKIRTRSEALEWLEKFGLLDRKNSLPTQLSGGEKQRISLCAALINQPRILLVDEPTSEVDSATRQNIIDIFLDLRTSYGLTIVIVTHDPVVANIADRKLRLEDGRLTHQDMLSSATNFIVECDDANRVQMPYTALDILSGPSLLFLEPVDQERFQLINFDLVSLTSAELDKSHLLMVDVRGRVLLPFNVKKVEIAISSNKVFLKVIRSA